MMNEKLGWQNFTLFHVLDKHEDNICIQNFDISKTGVEFLGVQGVHTPLKFCSTLPRKIQKRSAHCMLVLLPT